MPQIQPPGAREEILRSRVKCSERDGSARRLSQEITWFGIVWVKR
jgi:hypothetical protein